MSMKKKHIYQTNKIFLDLPTFSLTFKCREIYIIVPNLTYENNNARIEY